MKCSNAKCGLEGDSTLCPECGFDMEDTSVSSITCSGMKKDGSVCKAEIYPRQKFCKDCGTKVDKSRFETNQSICNNCGSSIGRDQPFCDECGQEQDISFCAVTKKSIECDDDDNTGSGWKSTSKEENATAIEKGSINNSTYDDSEQHNNSSDDTCAAFNGEEIMTNQENSQLKKTYPPDVNEKRGIQLENSTLHNAVKYSTDSDKESETVVGKENRSNRVTDVGVSDVKDEENIRYLGQEASFVTKLGEGTDVKINIEEIIELNSDGVSSCNPCHDIINFQNIRADYQNECKACANWPEPKHINENADFSVTQPTDENPPESQDSSTKSESKSSIRQNEGTTVYDEVTVHSESSADEDYDSVAENERECSESEVKMPDNGIVNVPKTSQYHKPRRKQKHRRKKDKRKRKMATEAKKKQVKAQLSSDINGNYNPANKVRSEKKSTQNVDSEESKKVFGAAKAYKDEMNESSKNCSRPDIFTTKESENIKDKTPDANKSNLSNKSSGDQGSSPKEKHANKKVRVVFHGLISKEFNVGLESHKLILRINDNWDNKTRVCQVKRIDEDLFEFKYSTELPVSRNIFYKYCVKKPDEKYDWEHYTNSWEQPFNRVLLNTWKESDEWHQYDGLIRKKKGIWKQLSNLFIAENLIHHAKLSAEYFSKRIMEGEYSKPTFESLLDELKGLFVCLRKIYFYDTKSWGHYDESVYVGEVGLCVVSPFLNTMLESSVDDVWSEAYELKVRAAISVVLLIHETNKLNIYETRHWDLICQILRMRPNEQQGICHEYLVVEKFFPRKKKNVLNALKTLACFIATNTLDPSWLYIMPWIHFLSDWCQPFQDPPYDISHDSYEPLWWGLDRHLNTAISYFQAKSDNWTIPQETVFKQLEPMFKADFLLQRTFLTVIPPKTVSLVLQHGTIATENLLAHLVYLVRMKGSHEEVTNHVEEVSSIISRTDRATYTVEQRNLQRYISNQLIHECTERVQDKLFVCAYRLFLHTMIQYDLHSAESAADHRNLVSNMLLSQAEKATRWIKRWKRFDSKGKRGYFQIWNSLFIEDTVEASKLVVEIWNPYISNALTESMQRLVQEYNYMATEFMQGCFDAYDRYCISMQECLSNTAFQVLSKGGDVCYEKLNTEALNKIKHLLSDVFVKEWTQNCVTFKTDSDILRHFLQWPMLIQYLKMYQKEDFFTDECLINLMQVVSVIQLCVASVLSGEITLSRLKCIQNTHNSFPDVASLIDQEETISSQDIKKAIAVRQREFDEFNTRMQHVTRLMNMCHHLEQVDRTPVDEVLENASNPDEMRLCDFCLPTNLNEVDDNGEAISPCITAFKLSENVLNMLPSLSICFDSTLFMKMWEKQCRVQNNDCFTLDDVEEMVWRHVKHQWDSLAEDVRNGSITFRRFEKQFGRHYDDNYEHLKQEFEILGVSTDVIEQRVKQLREYKQVENCVSGAQTLMDFARQYKLKGDFGRIKVIASPLKHDPEMRYFDESVMKACEILKDISEDQKECISTFLKCQPLIQWLNETMKSGLKELKVFVDLAFMSVGDEQMQIDKVQCFHSAVTGYAPLIFDIKPTCDYKLLLERCRLVWTELRSNRNLPTQLTDTCRILEWLKEIQRSLGSVELTSLMQAAAINHAGIFKVGRYALGPDSQHGTQLELQNVISLTVPDEQGSKQNRHNFSQLQDLQSRLMLVAGKTVEQQDESGSESVERFTMIFDSITRLAKVYLKLSSSGCVLFDDLTATFFCHSSRTLCAVLEFGHTDNAPHLKGRIGQGEDIKDLIPKLASFLEKCLVDWLQNIKEKRQSYLHLNFFTVNQLIILQRELVKLGTEVELPCRIYPLLSAVKLDCSQDDLLQAMKAAKKEIENKEVALEHADDECTTSPKDDNTREDIQSQTFIRELIESGFDEDLAVQALQHVDPHDIDDGIVWCMNHEKSVHSSVADRNDDDINETAPTQTFDRWSQSQIDMQSLIATNVSNLKTQRGKESGRGIQLLMEDLQELWGQFLHSIYSSISDFINLEHLGIILQHLAGQDSEYLHRNFHPGLKEGQPNLILCPCDDVLLTTLALFLNENGEPLPRSDEVLLCTSDTTKDEVDIFLRRAIYDSHHLIHCLVNAECLTYDVSELAERCLEQHIQETRHEGIPYRLVVICGSENEFRSTFISSLDKYKRQPLHFNVSTIRDRLSRQLTIADSSDARIKPAAYVDLGRSSVRVIKSARAGVGKTLYKRRREEELARLNGPNSANAVSIPLQESNVDMRYVIGRLLEYTPQPGEESSRLIHVDIYHGVLHGVDNLLFNLLILGCLVDETGWVWRKSPMDLYLIETWPLTYSTKQDERDTHYVHQMFSVLPDTTCKSPTESLAVYRNRKQKRKRVIIPDQLFDKQLFESEVFQRPFQYLYHLESGYQLEDMLNNTPLQPIETPEVCLDVLLRHCGVHDPSWLELHHFVWFLNTQLIDFERSAFTGTAAAELLPGFSTFVLRFLIQMSKDFATRSLKMSEESPGQRTDREDEENDSAGAAEIENDDEGGEDDENIHDELKPYQFRRKWENSPHPYLFFNSDRTSFTFFGFYIDRNTGNLIDTQNDTVLVKKMIDKRLSKALYDNKVPVTENFDDLPRHEKIQKLCNVMGIDMPHDPDDSYELTTDNVKKILAIYMRFRCNIPVIIMGETGCGKTRLIKFMCALQAPPGLEVPNMILMKVHGGTTKSDIERNVMQANRIASENTEKYGRHMYTVLFFDEANTTDAIGLIKEIMCDKTLSGQKIEFCENLKVVAACNPYRKHSDELIQKLEQAGLGYHVDADETTDRLGRVPMRRLVYRVQPLPPSLLPLVWDFGQLNLQVEDLYIRQMVRRYIRNKDLPGTPGLVEVVSAILTASQVFMRRCNNECSFVSLRDVDRVLTVMSWFYQQSLGNRTLYNLMDNSLYGENEISSSDDEDEEVFFTAPQISPVEDITRSLILALGACYHACLRSRPEYRAFISRYFGPPCRLPEGEEQIQSEIECCQDVILSNITLDKNIARNMALKENVFMMVVCIELRIPLFLVGKPGSSKSLAKTIVSDAMQGNAAEQALFNEMKQVQMVSFQCSPLSTPDGIVSTFRQCAQFQKDKDLKNYVSVVVLDEIGLAEDSPRMPLKTLHPLLEDGCQGDETPAVYKKVAFIGISNWALDPAKMNRGILVQRDVPDLEELVKSARGICHKNKNIDRKMEILLEPMAKSYLDLFETASKEMREFYGLRDFYSLVKMVCGFVEKSKKHPTWHEMLHAIKRNFGGLDKVDSESCFRNHLMKVVPVQEKRKSTDPECSQSGLIKACLFDTNKLNSESRYLLLLTENYGALNIMQQIIRTKSRDFRPITIFGSSFRCDQEYTQVCRNINKIKVCMETGKTVVLLNLENLYESLYDALNQYYAYFGGERYVDLGLGTHRVKCPVHKMFRLIVVAEKATVYKKFPIPLINRLEKHFFSVNTMLSPDQLVVVQELKIWAEKYCTKSNLQAIQSQRCKDFKAKISDVFVGYNEDTCSAIILDVWEKHTDSKPNKQKEVLEEAKVVLLWSATPDSVANLKFTKLCLEEQTYLNDAYFKTQAHGSLMEYLQQKIGQGKTDSPLFAQITTHSKLMASVHKKEISGATNIPVDGILFLESLSSFDTEQQFSIRVRQFLQSVQDIGPHLMIIQCDSGDINAKLVACARHCVMDELEKMRDNLRACVHVLIILQLPRQSKFSGFQCGLWHSVHIDDLYREEEGMPKMAQMIGRSVATIVTSVVCGGPTAKPLKDVEANDTDEAVEIQTPMRKKMETAAGEIAQFYGILLNSVHAALAIVKDKEENTSREIDRVKLVLKLLQENEDKGSEHFVNGVCCLLAKLLNEKESRTLNHQFARDWVVQEAATDESLNKTGTFRRSCIQTLQNKVTPMLAGILAFLDTNDNLKLLQANDSQWKIELWYTFLHNQEVLNLQYADMQSPGSRSELPEVTIKTTGYASHSFSAMIPFSWLIIGKIEELTALPNPTTDESDTEEESSPGIELVVNVLKDNSVGQLLNTFTDAETVSDIEQGYVHDFVHTVYHAASETELQLVCQTYMYQTSQLRLEVSERSLLHTLVCVHKAHKILAQRMLYFREMNKVWHECSSVIQEIRDNEPDNFMCKEEELIFTGLYLMIESLVPTGKLLNDTRDRMIWLNKVHRFRPIVEKLIHLPQRDPYLYGAQSYKCMCKAKLLWNRVLVVKLFLEHVCISERREDGITIKYCMPLWTLLGEETNMKEIGSLKGLEKFLKTCNKQARAQYLGDAIKCSHCEVELDGPPITLPCEDVLCRQCYGIMKALGDNKCQKCRRTLLKDWAPLQDSSSVASRDKLKDYQKRCNSFFMDVVSQLCFADNEPPSKDVVEHLLGYIFFTSRNEKRQCTRDLSVLDTGIDPSPVFRSFLLQLLLKTSEDHVDEYLGCYLDVAEEYVPHDTTHKTEQLLELNLLVIQCIENKLLLDCSKGDAGGTTEAQCALTALRSAFHNINTEGLDVDKLYAVARARMGLSVAAKYIAHIIKNDVNHWQVDHDMRRVIDAAWRLHDESKLEWTRVYLVKYLCRRYGIDTYHRACKSTAQYLRWLALKNDDDQQVVEVSDRYVVCGESYRIVREALTQVVLGENVDHITNIVENLGENAVNMNILLGLAMHREISSSYLYPAQRRKLTTEIIENFEGFIENCDQLENEEMFNNIIKNELSPQGLVITENENQHKQGLQCLLVHFMLVMDAMDCDRTLLQPLQTLIQSPESCLEMYLPTMPQDDLETVKEALLNARTSSGNENPVFYHCPNGHLYVIGNCGRPGRIGVCQECGVAIGGERHELLRGNFKNDGNDTTATGHILGTAENRGPGPNPERMMTPTYCATVRLVLHMAMYIASGTDQEGVLSLIKPALSGHDLEMFLWDHIQLDVEDIHRALGRSTDDVLLMMHVVLHSIVTTLDAGEHSEDLCQLSSKNAREDWETKFCTHFLEPVIKNLDNLLKEYNQQLAQDKRLGADPLLCLLYETDSGSSEKTESTQIQDIARVWRYRTPISWQHLVQEVNTRVGTEHGTHQQHKILQLFIEDEHLLKALRFIPSILRLQHILLEKYQRKIDKKEASQILVANIQADLTDDAYSDKRIFYLMKSLATYLTAHINVKIETETIVKEIIGTLKSRPGEDTDVLLQDFTDAWDIVRGFLKTHVCYTKFGSIVVQEKYCSQRITPKTPISLLLPTTRDAGLCSYAMLDFLMRKHNSFLDRYCKESNRKSTNISTVPPKEVTSAHVISYDPEHDILPLVLANCQYSFEMGKGTKIEYDFAGLERQLMDRFLFSKSRIDVGSVLQIDQMVYRSELTDAEVFHTLEEKIPQEPLKSGVKADIRDDLRSLPDVCKTLDNVDIAIHFLKTTGGKQEDKLHIYMVNKLQMSQDCNCSQTAKQVCEFKHSKALWLFLSLLKAKQMVKLQQHSEAIFESVPREFHDDLPENILSELHAYLKNLSIDNLSHLVEVTHEFILLKVAVRENNTDEDFLASTDFKFGEYLYGYFDSMENHEFNAMMLMEFPQGIFYKHCVHTWIQAYLVLNERCSATDNL